MFTVLVLILFNLDAITDHPEFKLFQASFPAFFEPFHPLTIFGRVRHVNDDSHEIVSVEDATMTPVAFDFLCLVTGRAEVVHDLQNGFGEPFRGHIPSIIELEREQYLESPPLAAHRSPFP